MRLGVRSGMITGKDLHDAAVALGLTRFSLQDVNTLVNKLAAAYPKFNSRHVQSLNAISWVLKVFKQ